ncbi:hypothetical protein F5B21DRAFT_265834 [Xylaria acuta]|nr:hypothetical protein F5B21DRAFT_265834 [Xylaria acuta]
MRHANARYWMPRILTMCSPPFTSTVGLAVMVSHIWINQAIRLRRRRISENYKYNGGSTELCSNSLAHIGAAPYPTRLPVDRNGQWPAIMPPRQFKTRLTVQSTRPTDRIPIPCHLHHTGTSQHTTPQLYLARLGIGPDEDSCHQPRCLVPCDATLNLVT